MPMQIPTYELTHTPIQKEHKRKLIASSRPGSDQYDQVISGYGKFYLGGELVGMVLPAPEGYERLLGALMETEFSTRARSNGLESHSATFGYYPRGGWRRDFCTSAVMASAQPEQHKVMLDWAEVCSEQYREQNPVKWAAQAQKVNQILPEWRIRETVFTSGIANKDNPLGFHCDAGNFPDNWSCMVALQRDVAGGYLVIPEWRTALDFGENPSLVFFDGAKWMHGVSDIRKKSGRSYRYTVVYYALAKMCQCDTIKAEIARIRELKTQREHARRVPK